MECCTEEQGLHPVLATRLDLLIQLRQVFVAVLLLEIICFIQDEELDLGDIQLASLYIVHDLRQRAHSDVDPSFQLPQLRLFVHTTDEETDSDWRVFQVLAEFRHALVGLVRQVPGGFEDQAHRQLGLSLCVRDTGSVVWIYLTKWLVLLNTVLHGAVELRHGCEGLAADVRLQAHLSHLLRDGEGDAEVLAVFCERDGVFLSV
mmetsp:Transcript_73787/g.153752  ORF Transcript_73787/g.153752 Transcript_73787/m.153752 type:complete len:204 (+) Transcript_73787:1376-1987(+)